MQIFSLRNIDVIANIEFTGVVANADNVNYPKIL
jgi:hypothetical protein